MAENPKIMMRSLKNGIRKTTSLPATAGFLASSRLNKINNKKQMLQIKVKREKNEINFIKEDVLKILSTK